MRTLLLLAWLLACLPAHAQSADTLAPRPVTATTLAAPDTVAALHRLFQFKRRQSAPVIISTVGTGFACLALAESTRHTANFEIPITPILAIGISLLSIPATAVELLYYRQFTRHKEAKALRALAEHRLPDRIRQFLKPEYFQPKIREGGDPSAP